MTTGSGLVGLLVGAAGVATAVAGEAPPGDALLQYGPWAVAFAMLLFVGKDIVLQAMGKTAGAKAPAQDDAMRNLATALEKLSMVLERIEHDQEKSDEEILAQLHEIAKTLQGTDFRTKEIRDMIFKAERG